jgi:serine/threonine protein kinase
MATPLPIQPDPLASATLGSWRLERWLGGGKTSRVYKARHDRLNRRAAVKVLDARLAKDDDAVSRFFCEARAVAELNAEHLVDIFDFVYDPNRGHVAYAMELLRGRDLRQLLDDKKRLAPARAARIAAQLCDALSAIHKAGVVHRDLRPSNIMLVRRGGDPDYVKVIDFGLARFPGKVRHATGAGEQLGSPLYTAPEQANSPDVDARADLYAVGCILFHMLTGAPPFRGNNAEELIAAKANAARAPSPIGDHGVGDVSPALAAVVQKLIARDPADRFPDAASARTALLGGGELDPWSGDDRTMAVQPLPITTAPVKALDRARSYGYGLVFAIGLACGVALALLR